MTFFAILSRIAESQPVDWIREVIPNFIKDALEKSEEVPSRRVGNLLMGLIDKGKKQQHSTENTIKNEKINILKLQNEGLKSQF